MDKSDLRIRESFSNPVVHILPILTYIIINHVFNNNAAAWIGSAIVALGIGVYVRISYRMLFNSYLFCVAFYVLLCSCMNIASYLTEGYTLIHKVSNHLIFLLALILFLFLRKLISKISNKLVSPLVPMGNNVAEFYRLVCIFTIFTSGYLLAYFLFNITNCQNTATYLLVLDWVQTICLALVILYWLIRVSIIRSQLAKESWLPILTADGKIKGSIQRTISFTDNKKYMHPVVRAVMIDKGKILMQKPINNDDFYKTEWDVFASRHVEVGESAEDSLNKTALDEYGIDNLKVLFISKYILQTPYEHQYVLFYLISSYGNSISPNPEKVEQIKWWTLGQVEDNLQSGIFNANFIQEWEILKRMGLINDGEDEDWENFEVDPEEERKFNEAMKKKEETDQQ